MGGDAKPKYDSLSYSTLDRWTNIKLLQLIVYRSHFHLAFLLTKVCLNLILSHFVCMKKLTIITIIIMSTVYNFKYNSMFSQ